MEETAAGAEEISAISDEIEFSVGNVANKAEEGAVSSKEIGKRALKLKDNSKLHQKEADETRVKIRKEMEAALNKTKEVEKIKILSDAILEISRSN